MNKIELEKITDIIKFNEILENIYNNLAKLEIAEKKDSKEYQDNINYAKITVEVINKKLKSLNITPKELCDFEENIGALNRFNEDNHDILVDILDLSKNNKIRRLCMQLYYHAIKTNSYVIEDEFIADEMKGVQDEITELTETSLEHEDNIEYLKDKLIANTLMDYLLEEIKNQKDRTIRNELIRVKYRLIYLYEHLENIFLNDQDTFTRTPVIQELLNIEIKENDCDLEEIYIEPVNETTKCELDYLANLDDEFYNSKKNIVRVILRTLYIKTYLSINISKISFNQLEKYRKKIKPTSETSKQYIEKAYNLKKELTTPKMVDF